MLYGSKCQSVKKQQIKKNVTKIGMLRWLSGNILRKQIKNKNIRGKLEVAPKRPKEKKKTKLV